MLSSVQPLANGALILISAHKKRRHEDSFRTYSIILEEQKMNVKHEIAKIMRCGHPF